MTFTLKPLPYAYNALEPHIDKKTMMIHHDKHHQAYCDKFNTALEKHKDLQKMTPEQILADLSRIPDAISEAVRNNGGGYVNHNFFWSVLKKDVPAKGEIIDAIVKQWGSLDAFKEEFSTAAVTQFGSGWAWLVWNGKTLEITKTANQDTPLSNGKHPLLCLDVWEHAYYLHYQNKRPDYIKAFWHVVNWAQVNNYFKAAKNA